MSLKTDNFKLYKYEDNDIGDLRFLHDSMDTIDKGLTLDVGSSTGTGNNYVLNLGSLVLKKGMSLKFWADKDSNGTVTINGTYNLVKANGTPVKNLKRNAPYVITYDGSANFFLASGGVDDVSFSASDLLSGKTANNSDGEKVAGTMPNIGQQTATINAGGKIVITKGYHDGTGYVQSNSMSKQLTDLGATLTSANQLVNGVKAVDKNGNLITGTATIESLGGLVYRTGTITINNTDLTSAQYSIQLSELNLPRTPKFVACNWRITWYRREYGEEKTHTNNDYVFFDFVNSKCYYPTNTMWSHEGGSGTYKIVDAIRNFKDHNFLRMHTESDNRSIVPTKGDDDSFRRDPMIVDWFAVA